MKFVLMSSNWAVNTELFEDSVIELIADEKGIANEEVKSLPDAEREIFDEIEFESYFFNKENEEELMEWSFTIPGFIVSGQLELWNRSPKVFSLESDLKNLITKCLSDNDDYTIEYRDGHIEITNNHHDGTNHFKVYPISDKGVDLYNDWQFFRLNGSLNYMRVDQVMELILRKYVSDTTLYFYGGNLPFWYVNNDK